MRTTTMKPRILVADDNRAMRELIARSLDGEHDVLQAEDGHQLLRWIDLSNLHLGSPPLFDLIVSDHRMPGATGMQCLEYMRSRGDSTPLLLITAFGDAAIHRGARSQGACAVLDKPFDLEVLRSIVRAALRSPRSRTEGG